MATLKQADHDIRVKRGLIEEPVAEEVVEEPVAEEPVAEDDDDAES